MTSGIYALHHRASGKLYIGSTRNFANRRSKWWAIMNRNPQDLPPEIRDLTKDREDWGFEILHRCAISLLLEHEISAIDYLRQRAPERLLNRLAVQRPDQAGLSVGGQIHSLNAWSRLTGVPRATISHRLRHGWSPEEAVGLVPHAPRDQIAEAGVAAHRGWALSHMASTIIGPDGLSMTVAEAARQLGCSSGTLSERLRRRRERGVDVVYFSELLAGSQQHRAGNKA
jgi:hypothetical protein